MKILVTGGTGRIGANLVMRLLERGHDIRSFVYPGDSSRANKLDSYDRVETVVGDLRNFDDVKQAVEGVDAIYHLAAAFGGPFDNLQYLNINGMGTLNILECIREGLPNLHRFIYACTEAIYWRLGEKGRFFDEPISEEMVSRYKHMPYFLTKWIGEELAMTYHYQYGVPTTVFRFATVIEPGEFLNEDGLPRLFLFNPVYERYKDETGDNADEAGDDRNHKIALDRRGEIPHQSKSEWASLQTGIYGCPGYCPRIGFGNRKRRGDWRRIHTWGCGVVPMGGGCALPC